MTFAFRRYEDSRLLGAIPLNPFCEQRYGAPWWTIHRGDYQKVLFEEALRRGASIKLDHRVIDVDLSKPTVTVQSSDKVETYEADLIIGADGLRSRIRTAFLGDTDPGLRPSSICAYRALVPLIAMNANEQRKPFMDPTNTNVDVWLGSGHFILAYPVRSGPEAQYNLVLVHPEKDEHTRHDLPPRFPRPASVPEVSAHYVDFCPEVKSILSQVVGEDESEYWIEQAALAPKDGILEWKLSDLDDLPTWSSADGTVIVIGDAAHAQRPYMSAGASTAVEDAVALAEFLKAEHLAQHGLKKLIDAFVSMRKPRTSKMQRLSAADSACWSLERGPAQARRDGLLVHLGDQDRQECARAMAQLKAEGIGEFNFGDADVMDWAWSYDVTEEAREVIKQLAW